MNCVCGHVEDEHDPRTIVCEVEDCDCIAFEPEEDIDAYPALMWP